MIRHHQKRSSIRFLICLFWGGAVGFVVGMLLNPPFEGYFMKPPLYDDSRGLIFFSWLLFGFVGVVAGGFVGSLRKR